MPLSALALRMSHANRHPAERLRAPRRGADALEGISFMKTFARIAAAAVLFACTPALAQDGDDWKFQLVNHSDTPISGVYTIRRDGKWSGNWIKTLIAPTRFFNMTFKDPADTRCEVRTRIVFTDGSEYDTPVNYCDITKVIVNDETITSE